MLKTQNVTCAKNIDIELSKCSAIPCENLRSQSVCQIWVCESVFAITLDTV